MQFCSGTVGSGRCLDLRSVISPRGWGRFYTGRDASAAAPQLCTASTIFFTWPARARGPGMDAWKGFVVHPVHRAVLHVHCRCARWAAGSSGRQVKGVSVDKVGDVNISFWKMLLYSRGTERLAISCFCLRRVFYGPPYLFVLILLISSSPLNTSRQPPLRASTSAPSRRLLLPAPGRRRSPSAAAAAHPPPSPPPTRAAPLAPPSLSSLSVVPRAARSSSSPVPRAWCKEGVAFRCWGWAWQLPPARDAGE
jgi:hypothetical protein